MLRARLSCAARRRAPPASRRRLSTPPTVTVSRGRRGRPQSWVAASASDAFEARDAPRARASPSERARRATELAVTHFLPKGYPRSVAPGYAQFASAQLVGRVAASLVGARARAPAPR